MKKRGRSRDLSSATLAFVKRFLVLMFCFSAAVATSSGARADTKSEHQIWTSTTLQTKPLTTWRLLGWLDLHDRRRSGSNLFIVRPALGLQLVDTLAVHAGYAWVPSLVDGGDDSVEHRTWQQLLWNAIAAPAWMLSLRPRYEQRFAEGVSEVGHRLRLMARTTYRTSESGVLLILFDEFFYQLNDVAGAMAAGFDQNRVFAGVGFPSALGVRFEVGYLNVYAKRSPTSHLDHNLAINAFWTY